MIKRNVRQELNEHQRGTWKHLHYKTVPAKLSKSTTPLAIKGGHDNSIITSQSQ